MEEKIRFSSDAGELEGLLSIQPGPDAVAVAHPHPQYGGEMRNYVVEGIVDAFAKKLFTTLRFNFRGVGRSDGSWDEGEGETRDLVAAAAHLASLGKTRIALAGYSFGAWVVANAAAGFDPPKEVVLVAPPVGLMDFSGIRSIPGLLLTVVADRDEVAPLSLVKEQAAGWDADAPLEIIPNTNHFFTGALPDLEKRILDRIKPSEGGF